MVIAVTGASGRLGRRVAELLLDLRRAATTGLAEDDDDGGDGPAGGPSVEQVEVVLLSRRPDRLDGLRDAGATVRAADFEDPAGLARALVGVKRLLLVSTDALDRRVVQHRHAIDAAAVAGVEHVVYTSLSDPVSGNPVAMVTDAHRLTEEHLLRRAPRWTILRNATYADALVPIWVRAARRGRLTTSAGEGRTAWVARDDCAAVAAAVLTGDGHDGRTYEVTGPRRLDAAELTRVLARWAGHPVEVAHVADDEMAAALVADGIPEPRARLVALWHRAIREGYFAACTTAVHDITGRPPRSVADLLSTIRPERLHHPPATT